MTKSRAAQAPPRPVERKYEKTARRNRNHNRKSKRHRNRNRAKNPPQFALKPQLAPQLVEPSNRTFNTNHSSVIVEIHTTTNLDLIQSSQSEQFRLNDLPTDITQTILTFLSIYDLSASVRRSCVELRNMTSIDKQWVRNMMVHQMTLKDDETLTYFYDPFRQLLLFITKTYHFGRALNRSVCKMKRRGPINEELFFICAALVFYHQSQNFKCITVTSISWHEITMSCSHGMERITVAYLSIYLRVRGMDENKMDENGRKIVRTEYLTYKALLIKDGTRTVTQDSKEHFFEEMDDYDLESAEEMFEESMDENQEDRAYPICGLTKTKQAAKVAMDPLGLMSSMRNGKMARRIVRLFMDFKNGVPPEAVEQCQAVVRGYMFAILRQPHPDDAEVIQFIVSNLFNVEPRQTFICSVVLTSMTLEYSEEMLTVGTKWATEVFGYSKRFVYEDWMNNRIEFAHAMVPFLVETIQVAHISPHHLDQLCEFVRSETNPMTECVVLKEGIKCLISSVVDLSI